MYAIASTGKDADSKMADRFGRAPWFILFNEDGSFNSCLENNCDTVVHGAGGQTVALLASKGVKAVVGPQFGPNAVTSLQRGSIEAYEASDMICSEAMKSLKAGDLKKAF